MRTIVSKTVLYLFVALTFASTAQAQNFQDWSWAQEEWRNSDKSYLAARQNIAKIYEAGKVDNAGLVRYKNAANARPNDPLARFKWGYYALCLALQQPDVRYSTTMLYPALLGFEQGASPGVYQYTRLRFLMLSVVLQQGPETRALAERLLRRDPKDYFVKFYAIRTLRNGSDSDQSKALQYAQDLVKQTPREPSVYVELAFTYQQRWWRHKNPEDAKKAIAGYRQYLALAKPTGKARERIEFNIKDLEQSIKKS